MRNLEACVGGTAYLAIWLVLVFAVLEPVDVARPSPHGQHMAASACADAGNPTLLCETSTL